MKGTQIGMKGKTLGFEEKRKLFRPNRDYSVNLIISTLNRNKVVRKLGNFDV